MVKSFSFQWILDLLLVLLTRNPAVYLGQFVSPIYLSRQLCLGKKGMPKKNLKDKVWDLDILEKHHLYIMLLEFQLVSIKIMDSLELSNFEQVNIYLAHNLTPSLGLLLVLYRLFNSSNSNLAVSNFTSVNCNFLVNFSLIHSWFSAFNFHLACS